MSTESSSVERHSVAEPSVTRAVETLRAAMPFVRPLVLAVIATALIMIGLPAVLALGAAAGT
ncbi:MAG TPA: hypothetical protein VK992_06745 [Candidatus Caenarcaniphilales bacterium]|nr:hypothetical protein [Candidatus Caenarcaniphilales bacterium]